MPEHSISVGIRKPRRWALGLGLSFGLLIAALLLGFLFSADHSRSVAFARYRAIQSGMTPADVLRLMHDDEVIITWGTLGNGEVYHFDGRYMIGVVYEPNPKRPTPPKNYVRPNEDWVVRWKTLTELGRGGQVDDVFVGLRLKPRRIVKGDRP